MDRVVKIYSICFFFLFHNSKGRLKSSKSHRHISLQAHRQMPQTVWDSSPVCEFLKCAFWPEDTEKVNTLIKQHRFYKSRIQGVKLTSIASIMCTKQFKHT